MVHVSKGIFAYYYGQADFFLCVCLPPLWFCFYCCGFPLNPILVIVSFFFLAYVFLFLTDPRDMNCDVPRQIIIGKFLSAVRGGGEDLLSLFCANKRGSREIFLLRFLPALTEMNGGGGRRSFGRGGVGTGTFIYGYCCFVHSFVGARWVICIHKQCIMSTLKTTKCEVYHGLSSYQILLSAPSMRQTCYAIAKKTWFSYIQAVSLFINMFHCYNNKEMRYDATAHMVW